MRAGRPFLRILVVALLWAGAFAAWRAWEDHQPRVDPVGMAWVHFKGGTYVMGSRKGEGEDDEHPMVQRKVRPFDMARTETTVAQYRRCVAAGVCTPPHVEGTYCNWAYTDREDHPANCVDWFQATAFCAWVGGRLPNESQWEYAARSGGKDIQYPWGDAPEPTCDNVTRDQLPERGCGRDSTWPVCSRPAGSSEQGLCDLAGNVNEWMSNCYHPYRSGPLKSSDKETVLECPLRALRGGGIGCKEGFRNRNRLYHDPGFSYGGLGFRCIRTEDPDLLDGNDGEAGG